MQKVARFIAATTLALVPLFLAQPSYADGCVSSYQSQTVAAATSESVVRTIETCGGDDVSYRIPLDVKVSFDGREFTQVFATTNSVITFGTPDNTYWDYPGTPSISLYSMDWLIIPSRNTDEHLIIQSSNGGFQVDISARPYWMYNTLEPTNIIITAAINADGTVAMSYVVSGPVYDGQARTGVRLTDGSIVTLEDYGIVQVEEVVELTPEPVQPTPSPSPTPEPVVTPPVIIPEPVSPPSQPDPAPYVPEPEPVLPVIPENPEPVIPVEPIPEPEPSDSPSEPVVPSIPIVEPVEPIEPEPDITELDPATIDPASLTDAQVTELVAVAYDTLLTAEPGSAEYVQALEQLAVAAEADDPELPAELAAIPFVGDVAGAVLDAFSGLGNIGADISPEERERAEKVVVGGVIVGQLASVAMVRR